jgi:NAD(P)-dependent dehydrogenase (short-subunit alcohol dehydrogenase family)
MKEARMGELQDKVAVITGAGSGMGRAAAQVFVREGAYVLAADYSGSEEETATELGDRARPLHCDVTIEADVEVMFAAALEAFGRVDAVLNVAGMAAGGPFVESTIEDYNRILDVNLKGVMLGTKHGARVMAATGGGSIVNWSSIGGLNASVGTSMYGISKAGVIALTKSAAVECGPQGIRANVICPGFIETAMTGGPGTAERLPHLIDRQAAAAGGEARRRGGAGFLPGIGAGPPHHRGDHPRRRRLHCPASLAIPPAARTEGVSRE